jgi:hypothetical protein
MMAQSVPMSMVQMSPAGIMPAGGFAVPGNASQVVQASYPPGGGMSPPGVPCGPGVQGAVAAVGALPGCSPSRFTTQRTSVRFLNPPGMKVSWFTPNAQGQQGFNSVQLETPGRYNFIQAAIYRLKLSNIPNRPGLDLYPTLEVLPTTWRTEAYLAHSAVPVTFTEEDFEQVASGNFLIKVIYLPDPQFQDVATTGPDEVVSTRLEPGANPIAEAKRRGDILLIVRLGNIDLEAPNTPPMDAPNPYMLKNQMPKPGTVPSGHGAVLMPNTPMPVMTPNGPMPGSPYSPAVNPAPVSLPTGPVTRLPDFKEMKMVSGQASN